MGSQRGALVRELRTKGIDDEIAQATLAEIDPEDEHERASGLSSTQGRHDARPRRDRADAEAGRDAGPQGYPSASLSR